MWEVRAAVWVWKGLGDLEQVWLLWNHAGAVELWGSEQMSGSGCSGTIQALTSALEASEGASASLTCFRTLTSEGIWNNNHQESPVHRRGG